MSICILKFGGSFLGNIDASNCYEQFLKAAEIIREEKANHNKVVVVISALAGETRKLKQLSSKIFPEQGSREEDVILAAGEQVTAGLLAKLLNSSTINIKAQSLLAWQIPILTDNNHGAAKIISICPDKINQLLDDDFVVVVPGFQGVTTDNHITTLGFDGSDITALAIAGTLNAKFCRLYKDVDAIYSANPRRVELAQSIPNISYHEMNVLASLGAKIIHPSAVEIAKQHAVEIHITSPNNTMPPTQGTIIGNTHSKLPIVGITYYAHDTNNVNVSIVGQNIANTNSTDLLNLLQKNKILAELVATNFTAFSITLRINWLEQLDQCLAILHTHFALDSQQPTIINSNSHFDPAIS
jgi:aspartate kinase